MAVLIGARQSCHPRWQPFQTCSQPPWLKFNYIQKEAKQGKTCKIRKAQIWAHPVLNIACCRLFNKKNPTFDIETFFREKLLNNKNEEEEEDKEVEGVESLSVSLLDNLNLLLQRPEIRKRSLSLLTSNPTDPQSKNWIPKCGEMTFAQTTFLWGGEPSICWGNFFSFPYYFSNVIQRCSHRSRVTSRTFVKNILFFNFFSLLRKHSNDPQQWFSFSHQASRLNPLAYCC